MSDEMRKHFEARFPVPDGIAFEKALGMYVASVYSEPSVTKCNAKWEAWQAALEHAGRGVEPVAFAFESRLTGEMQDFSLTRHSVGMTPLYTQPPAPVVPEKREWNQATGRDDLKYTEGWNDCRVCMLISTTKPNDSEADHE